MNNNENEKLKQKILENIKLFFETNRNYDSKTFGKLFLCLSVNHNGKVYQEAVLIESSFNNLLSQIRYDEMTKDQKGRTTEEIKCYNCGTIRQIDDPVEEKERKELIKSFGLGEEANWFCSKDCVDEADRKKYGKTFNK